MENDGGQWTVVRQRSRRGSRNRLDSGEHRSVQDAPPRGIVPGKQWRTRKLEHLV